MSQAAVKPFGDQAILVEFADELSPQANGQARALARAMRDVPGVRETIPALRSVLIVIDTLQTDHDAVTEVAREFARTVSPEPAQTGRLIEVPVAYGGHAGPDLEEVAALSGITMGDVVSLHAGAEYAVYMLGFTPGFPYLGLLPDGLRVSRLATPRTRVPSGSIAIADALTGVYPSQTPGGWRLIGRTPLRIYNPTATDPILFRPGDRVRFVRIEQAEFPIEDPIPTRDVPPHPGVEILDPGLFTTVQDLGRPGFRHLGLPASGAIDLDALQSANIIVGNDAGAPVIEATAPGPTLRMLDDHWVAIAGADLTAAVDGTNIDVGKPVKVRAGQQIRFGPPRQGMWVYLAFSGGIEAKAVLGSASAYVAGRLDSRLARGDVLGVAPKVRSPMTAPIPSELMRTPAEEVTVRVIPGPQEAWFEVGARVFYEGVFRVTTQTDRAGIRLDGPAIPRPRKEMLSDAMLPGAIQIPPDGKPIVILADGPTTGGYPKIGVVATVDLPLIGQARPGARVRFVTTTVNEARNALRQRRAIFRELEAAGRTV